MKYEIKNNTEQDLVFSGVSFPSNSTTVIFEDDTQNYDPALELIVNSRNEIGVLITKEDFSFYLDGVDVGKDGFFSVVNEWDKVLEGTVIPYLSKYGNCYYHLQENKMRIYNPLFKKWYYIQFEEEIQN